jgi:penicillin-binding protein activator
MIGLRQIILVFWVLSLGFVAACGPRAFTRGERIDADEDVLLDDEFNESDMKLVADTLVGSLMKIPLIADAPKRPVVLITRIRNKTDEHIDMTMISDKIRVAISRLGKVSFVDGTQRDDILDEYRYQQSGVVSADTAKGPGSQIAPDYFLGGDLASNIQEAGNRKVIYYKLTLNLTNLKTGLIEWTDESEVKKAYKKRSVGW